MSILILIFCNSVFLLNIFKIEFKEALPISISLFSLISTFFGAWIGAEISGEYAVKNADRELFLKYQQNLYNYALQLEKIIEETRIQLIDLELTLIKFKSDIYTDRTLKTFKNKFRDWNEIYANIRFYSIHSDYLNKEIDLISAPSQLSLLNENSTVFFTDYKINPDQTHSKELNEDFYEYEEIVQRAIEKVTKTEGYIKDLKEKILSNYK
ncbi:hypothetical protein [Staphylococcus hominis]|uniref:hypothetical protein n=1 Tax=Staphylococcus hominis TaxID=1290 RepID=UPI00119EEBEC|nr:hypothetical protein [Staphylococcus hominis]